MSKTLEKSLYNVIKRKPNSSTVKQLIEKGVDCNLSFYDRDTFTFISPIHLAIKNDRHRTLCLLYEHRNSPTKVQLRRHVAFYIDHYIESSKEEENEILFDYCISRLLYFRINEHRQIIFHTLIAALHDFDYVKRRNKNLCEGSTHKIFLQLRIYTLFQKIIQMKSFENEIFLIIENELLHNLETYYFLDSIFYIPEVINEDRSISLLSKYYSCIATNLINKIKHLEMNKEYTIPTGWEEHAVCVSFRRINETHISIRIDNPSTRNPPNMHKIIHSTNGRIQIQPRVLGQLHINHLKDNLNYFILLIDSIKNDLKPKDGISLIYDLDHRIRYLNRKTLDAVPSFNEQAQANCFYKCFEPGFWIRVGQFYPRIYQQILLSEENNANQLAKCCEQVLLCEDNNSNLFDDNIEEYLNYLDKLHSKFNFLSNQDNINNISIFKSTYLQDQLKISYKQHYQYLFNNKSNSFLIEKYIPLRFTENKTLIELNDIFRKSRILLIGDAGCGKTTVCQYITYLWSNGGIWQDQYQWLFYIKMRNLNSEFYPFQLNKIYSLIDIIEKECFQGYQLSDFDKKKLQNQFENSSNILWILDGCDERIIPNYLHSIERELFDKKNLLLTSRPYLIDHLKYDMIIEIENFNQEDIRNYIEKYFSIIFKTKINECWTFIRDSEQLRKIASIPACLEIICNIWEIKTDIFNQNMTIGELYEKICEYLLRKYLLKFHHQCRSSLIGKDIYQQSNSIPFTYLEYIAFKTTQSYELIINGKDLANITGSAFLSILQIGLLISTTLNFSSIPEDKKYYFIHRSFQEYLSVRYMIRALALIYSKEQQNEVIHFITYNKYNRHLQNTFRLFFELKRSNSCNDLFWSTIDNQPRDLIGLRHFSRIIRWFSYPNFTFSLEDKQTIHKRLIDIVLKWILNKDRRAHDFSNQYLFDWFVDFIDNQYWLKEWKEDLFEKNPSKRRYFLSDLWSEKNIDVLKHEYEKISQDKIHNLHRLIMKGPVKRILDCLDIQSNLFTLNIDNNQIGISDVSKAAQEKANKRQSITTLVEFKELLQNYTSFAKLNRQTEALDIETWTLKIDESALENIDNQTLQHLSQLSEKNLLFYRDIQLPIIPFLELYAKENTLDEKILCSLIVSITLSSKCILTTLPGEKKFIRVYKKDETFVDIQLDTKRWNRLIDAFNNARYQYGFSSFFI